MDINVIKTLEVLAMKLGTTTELLWAALLRQAHISSICVVFELIISAFLLVVWAYVVTKNITLQDRDGKCKWEGDSAGLGVASVFVSVVIWFIAAAHVLPSVIAGFFNPEYWALMQVLGNQ